MPPDGPPYRPAAPKIFDSRLSKEERLHRHITKLEEEADKLYDVLELTRFRKDGANEYNQARKRYDEIAKEVEEWRAIAAKEKKKKEEERAAEERKRAAEAEEKRADEKAAAERRRKEEVSKKKDEELKELQARYDAERKARIEAEKRAAAELKKYQERLQKAHDDHKERVKKSDEEHQQKVKEADEQLKALHTKIADTKRRADLLANYDRIRAVEQARTELEDAKKRLQREHEEFQRKSYEAFQAEQRKLRRATEEAERYAKQKAKEILDARKETERRASLELPKEVGFDTPRNQTYDHRSSSQYHHRPEQHTVQHANKDSRQDSRQVSYEHSHSQNHRHSQEPTHRQYLEVNYQSSSQPYSWHHDKLNHRSTTDASRNNHSAPVGLSGIPAGSVIDSHSPVVASWEEKNQDWTAPQIPTWQRSYTTFEALEAERNASSDLVPRSRSPATVKEQWPLPPTPIPSPKIEAYTPQETEAERLRRKLAESEAKRAKMAAELERKKRVSGADSVATWQTGIKSIWEDPTKVTRKDDRDSGPQGHQSDASKAQASNSASNRHNERDSSSREPPKPKIFVQNLQRRKPSFSNLHNSSKSGPEVHRQDHGGDHASVKTQYFEAEEYLTSQHNTPRPKPDTQYAWQKNPGERYPSYVPPTVHRQPSPPPVLPPTPPRGSQVSTPAVVRPVPIRSAPSRQETKTPALTGLPGSWRDEQVPAQDQREKHWPANVSTPSAPSPAVLATKPYEISQSSHYSHVPKYVPPPPSSHYSGANYHVRKPSFSYCVAPYYPIHSSTHGTAIPMPITKPIAKPIAGVPSVPAYPPAYHPSYASYNEKAKVGPSGHNGDSGKRSSSFPSWGDKTAAQSSGDIGAQKKAPKKEDKGDERAWFSWGDMTAAQSSGDGGAQKEAPKKEDKGKERAWF